MMKRVPSEADEKFFDKRLSKLSKPLKNYIETVISYIYATGASDDLQSRENILSAALYYAKQSGKRVKTGKVPEKVKKITRKFSKKFINDMAAGKITV